MNKKNSILLALLLGFFAFAKADQVRQHIVSAGETVFSISKKYKVTEEDLFRLNPDLNAGLRAGTILLIPDENLIIRKPVTYKNHKVRRKETLFSISQEYKISILELKAANQRLYAEQLRKGDEIQIPVFETESDISLEGVIRDTKIPEPGEYLVKPKDTRYGIAKKFDLTVDELEELNSGLEDLQPGMIIKISSEKLKFKDTDFVTYKVRSQETIYGLSRRFNTSPDTLLKYNPDLKNGLKEGMMIKMPREHLSEEIDSYKVYTHNKAKANLKDSLRNKSQKKIALMLPLSMWRIDSTTTPEMALKKDRVMRISLDFYSGAKMALDSLNRMGISVDLDLYDSSASEETLVAMVGSPHFIEYDAVIGPLLKKNVEIVARELKDENIPVVSPLTNSNVRLYKNLFQARPNDDILKEALLSYVLRKGKNANLIIISDSKNLADNGMLKSVLMDATVVALSEEDRFSAEDLKAAMVSGKPNWILLNSNNYSFIMGVVKTARDMGDAYDVCVLTCDRGSVFSNEEMNYAALGEVKFTFPSVDKESRNRNNFSAGYYRRYNLHPSEYATRGFDIMMDLVMRLAASNDLYTSAQNNGITEQVESKFNYSKKMLGGYFNEAVYILQYSSSLDIITIE